MHTSLPTLLETVEVAGVQKVGRLEVFGLRWDHPNGRPLLTLDEAMQTQALVIGELGKEGSVPLIKVVNLTTIAVFLMAGEQLIGAKQNRVLNVSILVGPQSELPIPVSCVEAGRWTYRRPHFSSPGTMAHFGLRKMMTQQTNEGYRVHGCPASKQGEVWAEVSRKLGAMGSCSPSHELQKVYDDLQETLTQARKELEVPNDCWGAAFALDGHIAGADLFDKPATLTKLWPKLLNAYLIDALEPGAGPADRCSRADVRSWIRRAATARMEAYQSPGLGHDVRLEADGVFGAGLVVEEAPIHLSLFPLGR